MNIQSNYSEGELDFIREMMNIGSGNAGTALAQFLNVPVELLLPEIYAVPVHKVVRLIGEPGTPVTCARMRLLGDIKGNLLSIIPESQRRYFTELTKDAMLKNCVLNEDMERSMLLEIANIIAGVFLTSLHDASGWNIYHMVPELSTDMLQAVLAEPILEGRQAQLALVIMERLLIGHQQIDLHLVVIASEDSLDMLFSKKGRSFVSGQSKS